MKLNSLKRNDWIKIGLTFVTYIAGMASFFYFEHHLYNIEAVVEALKVDEVAAEHGVAGIAYALACGIMTVVFILINRELLLEQFHKLKHHFNDYIIWSLIGAMLVLIIQLANSYLFHGPHHAYTLVSNKLAGVFSIFAIISMAFCVAFVEEVFYKVCCFLVVEDLKPLYSGIISALLFGIFNMLIFTIFTHSLAIGAFLLYLCLGLKFAFLYSKTHTIYTSITAGTICSSVIIILTLLSIIH